MPPEACKRAREDLVACLLKSDCVLRTTKTPQECLKSPKELPLQCQHLISSYTDCKKGMLDMSRRFRGNHLSDKESVSDRGSEGLIGVVEAGDPGPDGRT